jgi:hypothetical protein
MANPCLDLPDLAPDLRLAAEEEAAQVRGLSINFGREKGYWNMIVAWTALIFPPQATFPVKTAGPE